MKKGPIAFPLRLALGRHHHTVVIFIFPLTSWLRNMHEREHGGDGWTYTGHGEEVRFSTGARFATAFTADIQRCRAMCRRHFFRRPTY